MTDIRASFVVCSRSETKRLTFPETSPTALLAWWAGDRFATTDDWLESRRSFSFGSHDDPADVGFGFLFAHNDETVPPGTGFATHPHQDLEIVT
ncbi:pirin family protein [Nonomuraea sp. NPDC003804]|uniref:pirin family protein n=1 Tax=Nonomuraea sp. NPDC003804 TaxID=3154547 RepID=UPI0033AD0D81